MNATYTSIIAAKAAAAAVRDTQGDLGCHRRHGNRRSCSQDVGRHPDCQSYAKKVRDSHDNSWEERHVCMEKGRCCGDVMGTDIEDGARVSDIFDAA